MGLKDTVRSLFGLSGFSNPERASRAIGPAISSPDVEAVFKAFNGQLIPLQRSETRWLMSDLEEAQHLADRGDFLRAGQLWEASKTDGKIVGPLSTRCDGLVALPKSFRGPADLVSELEDGHDSIRSGFDMLCPPQELALLDSDGVGCGVGVGWLMPIPGGSYRLVRLPVQGLRYRWDLDAWYYPMLAGNVPITPGYDGWVLHMPGGRWAPWRRGLWRAVGRAFIIKDHAIQYDAAYMAKLANPARVATLPPGVTDVMRAEVVEALMAWGVNSVYALPDGWKAELLESSGTGSEAFDRAIKRAEHDAIVAITGSEVLVDGGTGFQNNSIFEQIRSDLIKSDGTSLAYTVNSQILPQWTYAKTGDVSQSPCVSWNTDQPKDQNAGATALVQAANAINMLSEALVKARSPYALDVVELANRFGVPLDLDSDPLDIPITVEE